MLIVAANYADSLRRRSWDAHQEADLLDTVTDELRAHYRPIADAVPAEILALAARLDRPESECAYGA